MNPFLDPEPEWEENLRELRAALAKLKGSNEMLKPRVYTSAPPPPKTEPPIEAFVNGVWDDAEELINL